MPGTLYVVATPIGNLQDITLRAIGILKSINYIACEDTRKALVLLKSINAVQKPYLISYYDEIEDKRIPNIINLLLNGQDVALVSDSGTPLISDPGFPLIRESLKLGIKVISIPGPTAGVSALVSSGLPTDKFIFLGFLPKKEGNRLRLLENVLKSNDLLEATIIFYEAPHRLVKSLSSVRSVFGDIEIVLMREITKVHEERIKDRIDRLLEKYEKQKPRGEYVILFSQKSF